MDAASVSGLYDALFDFESARRGRAAYPIHKRLRWSTGHRLDVYDWAAEGLGLAEKDHVLDAGCGVGFGTIRLAERGAARATGITVSERELAFARRARALSPRADAITFERRSFDELPVGAFDVVVAVESLKHSANLGVTLRAILDSLRPGGRGVLVEDMAVGEPANDDARGLAADWRLTSLYAEDDYARELAGSLDRVEDLTAAVRLRGRLALASRLAAWNAALAWPGKTHAAAIRAFRGGVRLDRLYAAGAMRYKAMFFAEGDTRAR